MITSGLCNSYKLELLQAIHDFRVDTIKAAFYVHTATLHPALTTAYSATGEATGSGYPAGGIEMPVSDGYPAWEAASNRAVVGFDATEPLENVSMTFRGILIYNASKQNRAIIIIDRGVDVTLTNGTLELFENPAATKLIGTA